MTVGTVYTLYNGRFSCKYLCTFSGVSGWDLKRVMWPAKTKADGLRFPEIITINTGPQSRTEKK